MNASNQRVTIDGHTIGYQFNKKSLGKRRTNCVVHNVHATGIGTNRSWIKFNGMILEVKRSAYGWEAVDQLPQ